MRWLWYWVTQLLQVRLRHALEQEIEACALEVDVDRRVRLRLKAAELRARGFHEEADNLLAACGMGMPGATAPDGLPADVPTALMDGKIEPPSPSLLPDSELLPASRPDAQRNARPRRRTASKSTRPSARTAVDNPVAVSAARDLGTP